jgi:hypothetical protein
MRYMHSVHEWRHSIHLIEIGEPGIVARAARPGTRRVVPTQWNRGRDRLA